MTGRLADHDPVSLLLISAPEMGKTSIVTQKNCKAIRVFSDVTGRGLVEVCKLEPYVSHIVINDMVAIMSHKPTVNRYTQAMLNAITEEGIQALGMPGGIEIIGNGKRGIIACTTAALSKDGRGWWNKIGLTSRMLPCSFSHSRELTIKIKAMIDGEQNGMHPSVNKHRGVLKIPEKPVHVEFPKKYTEEIRHMADIKSAEFGEVGYRRLKQIRSLVCGHAILRAKRRPYCVGPPEVEFMNKITKYINYDKLTEL